MIDSRFKNITTKQFQILSDINLVWDFLVGKLHCLMKACPVQPLVRDKQFFIGRYIDFLRQKSYPKIGDYEKLGERLIKTLFQATPAIVHCH